MFSCLSRWKKPLTSTRRSCSSQIRRYKDDFWAAVMLMSDQAPLTSPSQINTLKCSCVGGGGEGWGERQRDWYLTLAKDTIIEISVPQGNCLCLWYFKYDYSRLQRQNKSSLYVVSNFKISRQKQDLLLFNITYLFNWLLWVPLVACRALSCSMWDLIPLTRH